MHISCNPPAAQLGLDSLRLCICPAYITTGSSTHTQWIPSKPFLLTTIVCCILVSNKLLSLSECLICLLSAAPSEDIRVRKVVTHFAERKRREAKRRERGPRSVCCCIFCSSHGLPALEEMMNRGFTCSPAAFVSSHHRI